jgi:hypothetical protein
METPGDRLTQVIDEFLIGLITVDVDWETKSGPDRWSAKEIIGHLLDSANINLHRFVRCTYEQGFKLRYQQNEWVAVQHYQEAKIEDLLTMWRLTNRQISRVLNNYPHSAWLNTCDTGKNEVELHTVEFLASDYLVHLEGHLRQILG